MTDRPRSLLVVGIALRLLFARRVWRMSSARARSDALAVRGPLAAGALCVLVLLVMSISAFPSPDLPKIT